MARRIDYRAGHLVVAQAWLPWLDEAGMFGGRSFDVAMSRYPFAEIHRRLDHAAAEIGGSPTIADFRADPDLVARETALLARARRIITPHHGIAALFPEQAVRLAWHRPPATPRASGDRVAFLGPTIARQRPDIVRALAAELEKPLIVFGGMLEGADFWAGCRSSGGASDPAGSTASARSSIPAALTSQPRRLLQASPPASPLYASPASGLDPADYVPIARFAGRAATNRSPGGLTRRVNLLFTSGV